MGIFPDLKLEEIVQVGDKTRLDASGSFVSKDEEAVTLVEIQPSVDDSFIDVTDASSKNWYLDWVYSEAATVTVVVRITTDGSAVTNSKTIEVITESTDNLLSTDADLVRHEPDILKWVPDGRNSFKNVHRLAQDLILQWLDRNGYTDIDGDKFTKSAMVLISEFTAWSKFMVLRLIFEGISNATDDIFHVKARRYEAMEIEARQRLIIRIDIDGSGTIDDYEHLNSSGRIIRR